MACRLPLLHFVAAGSTACTTARCSVVCFAVVQNTFIDDLFAFVITMPTLHRLSVFRDDLIFLIFLYQVCVCRKLWHSWFVLLCAPLAALCSFVRSFPWFWLAACLVRLCGRVAASKLACPPLVVLALLVCIAQKWKYRTDYTRTNEFGYSPAEVRLRINEL